MHCDVAAHSSLNRIIHIRNNDITHMREAIKLLLLAIASNTSQACKGKTRRRTYYRICYKLDEPDPHITSIEELMEEGAARMHVQPLAKPLLVLLAVRVSIWRMHMHLRPLFLLI